MLHGADAQVAMAEAWQSIDRGCRPESAGRPADSPEGLARQYATWSAHALDALRADRALTPQGEQFAGTLVDRARRIIEQG